MGWKVIMFKYISILSGGVRVETFANSMIEALQHVIRWYGQEPIEIKRA